MLDGQILTKSRRNGIRDDKLTIRVFETLFWMHQHHNIDMRSLLQPIL